MMNNRFRHMSALFALGLLSILFFHTIASGQGSDTNAAQLVYLPSILQNHLANNAATPTATFVSTAPAPTATSTATVVTEATLTPTQTATPTATPSATATEGPTPTPMNTSIPYPLLTYTCAAEPATGDSVLLKITITSSEPVPSAASFHFEPTTLSGPIDDILQPGPFQIVNMFTDDTTQTSPGALTQCDVKDACLVIYTLTESQVTRDIGETVDCTY